MYLIRALGEYLYVYHKTTEAEALRSISNGYKPYEWERERDPEVYQYLRGEIPPNYPVPAIPVHVSNPIAPLSVSDRYRAEVYYADGTVVRSRWNARHMASRY